MCFFHDIYEQWNDLLNAVNYFTGQNPCLFCWVLLPMVLLSILLLIFFTIKKSSSSTTATIKLSTSSNVSLKENNIPIIKKEENQLLKKSVSKEINKKAKETIIPEIKTNVILPEEIEAEKKLKLNKKKTSSSQTISPIVAVSSTALVETVINNPTGDWITVGKKKDRKQLHVRSVTLDQAKLHTPSNHNSLHLDKKHKNDTSLPNILTSINQQNQSSTPTSSVNQKSINNTSSISADTVAMIPTRIENYTSESNNFIEIKKKQRKVKSKEIQQENDDFDNAIATGGGGIGIGGFDVNSYGGNENQWNDHGDSLKESNTEWTEIRTTRKRKPRRE